MSRDTDGGPGDDDKIKEKRLELIRDLRDRVSRGALNKQ